ncbi:hypothetical protein Pint_26636 [Pistacia integerrima]|uniref:Uncharacterized protein n=1 Tax=Pistacia integerrima TaxID=434235 RepID=A0ACC0YP93_9ROSI|nr:hypothetical protein Pint_26636 [Pistacia integerrima]
MLYVMQETWDKSDYQFVRPPRLTEWYANQSSLAPGVPLDTQKCYKAGYNAVRKYTSKCLCNPFQSFAIGISG